MPYILLLFIYVIHSTSQRLRGEPALRFGTCSFGFCNSIFHLLEKVLGDQRGDCNVQLKHTFQKGRCEAFLKSKYSKVCLSVYLKSFSWRKEVPITTTGQFRINQRPVSIHKIQRIVETLKQLPGRSAMGNFSGYTLTASCGRMLSREYRNDVW